MRWLIALVSVCFLSSAMWADTPAERLSQQVAQAKTLADRHAYGEAAAVLAKLASDIDITTLPNWPDTLFARARYEALGGNPDEAMATLKYAADLEVLPLGDGVANEPEFTALRDRPEFKALVARLQREEALWKDSPALRASEKLTQSANRNPVENNIRSRFRPEVIHCDD